MNNELEAAQHAAPDSACMAAQLTEQEAALLQLAQALKQEEYCFTTVTPATHARVNGRPGNDWAADLAGVFGWSRLFREDLLPPPLFALMRTANVVVRDGDGWRSTVRMSSLLGQLFIHSAYPTTDTNAVFFGPDTYRFTLALNDYLARHSGGVRRCADIGCGAGPGAITLALAHPDAEVLALDINEAALRLTAVNAVLAGTPNVLPRYSNLLSGVEGELDLIIANPPYLLDPGERAYRHGGGGLGEGLSLAIADAAVERLAPGGALLLYTGVAIVDGFDRFRAELAARFNSADVDWHYREIDPDVFGEELLEPAYAETDRIAAVLVLATKRPLFTS